MNTNRPHMLKALVHLRLAAGLTLALTACTAAAPVAPTDVPPSATLPAPTATDLPPTPTALPTPTDIPPTPTAVPPTATPAPTATPTPGPGDVIYETTFEDIDQWETFGFDYMTDLKVENYDLERRNGGLYFKVKTETTNVYALLDQAVVGRSDVRIDVDVRKMGGPNRNNVAVVCRSNTDGWYEFAMHSGGLWAIYRYQYDGGFFQLAEGGSTAIRMQNADNHLTVVCHGNRLSFYINDVQVGSVTDSTFPKGGIGVSATAFDLTGVAISFENLRVAIPDPANPPGGASAPPAPPAQGNSGGPSNAVGQLPTVPVPGETVGNLTLQRDTLKLMVAYEMARLPECGQRRVVNTEFVRVTQAFQFNGDQPVAGQWEERWTLESCGSTQAYQVIYTLANGMINFAISPA